VGRVKMVETNHSADSETVKGTTVLWCEDNGNCLVYPTLDEVLALSTKSKHRYFFYNLAFDSDGIFKQLPMENLKELLNHEVQSTNYKGYILTYLGRNNVSISREDKKGRTMFWDLAQFYNYHHLAEMSKRYLPQKGWKQFGIDSEVIQHFVSEEGNTLEYFEEHMEEIKAYCIQDCKATKMLADYMQNSMEAEEYNFETPYSVGNTAMKYFKKYLITPNQRAKELNHSSHNWNIPRIHPTHWYNENAERRALENIWDSIARGGWNDCYQRGKFDRIWDYDIVSAYPTIMRDIPYWDGEWVETEDAEEILSAEYGLVDVSMSNLKLPLVPEIFMYFDDSIIKKEVIRWVSHSILHTTVNNVPFHTTLTTDQLRYLGKFCDIDIKGGWVLRPAHDTKPMEELINSLISKKMDAKKNHGRDSVEYMLAKKIMNSASGKFKQKFHSKYTWFFYPHVYAKITWKTKETIADLVIENDAWDALVSVSTDGSVFNRPLKHVDMSGELGSFELTELKDFVQVGNGIYWGYKDESAEEEVQRLRGLVRNQTPNELNRSLRANKDGRLYQRMRGFHILKYNLPKVLLAHPEKTIAEVVTRRPLHLRECYMHNKKLSISDTNRFIEIKKHININKEIKRSWEGRFVDMNDMVSGRIIKSKAWDIREALLLSKAAEKMCDAYEKD